MATFVLRPPVLIESYQEVRPGISRNAEAVKFQLGTFSSTPHQSGLGGGRSVGLGAGSSCEYDKESDGSDGSGTSAVSPIPGSSTADNGGAGNSRKRSPNRGRPCEVIHSHKDLSNRYQQITFRRFKEEWDRRFRDLPATSRILHDIYNVPVGGSVREAVLKGIPSNSGGYRWVHRQPDDHRSGTWTTRTCSPRLPMDRREVQVLLLIQDATTQKESTSHLV